MLPIAFQSMTGLRSDSPHASSKRKRPAVYGAQRHSKGCPGMQMTYTVCQLQIGESGSKLSRR